ncbi:MAG TPA: Ig-like domain-containing domain, partial [Paludibacteraceae bacterium]|nr:Ig-like domain-containing domain [Paludibacteraceae bacterium]
MKKYTRNIRFLVAATVTVAALYACANRGQGPQGGPKDETPPSVVKSFPNNKSLNVTKGKVEIIFDENVNVLKASDNVIISPPQRIAPEVKSYAKTVTVQLNDTLIPNTTYSINFGDAIVDNNESNPLKNYFFAFSTGNEIDTMQIAGTVIDAQNLNPVPGVTVGIYDDLSDTVFMKKPFLRISRTDNMGRFTVPNVRNGKYRVYALTDGNRDNFYQPGEALAYSQSVFTTTFENYMRSDTIWKDSVTVDTIMSVPAIRYLPDNVVLHYFKDETTRQYLVKSERTVPHRISMYFNTAAEHLPEIKALNVADWDKKILLQKNEK